MNGQVREAYNNKLKSQLFGLLCEREKGREWEKFLDSILIELMGYSEEEKTINYYIFKPYRKSVNCCYYLLIVQHHGHNQCQHFFIHFVFDRNNDTCTR